jgi:anti-sigma factor RsiW
MNEHNGHMPFVVGLRNLAFRHVDDRLAAYTGGECSERECVAVERHLDACAACRAALDETQRIRALLAPLAAQATPRSVADAVLARLAASTGEGSAGLHVAESSTAEVSPHSTDCPVSPAGDVSLPVARPGASSLWRRREGVPERDTAAMERHTSTSTRTPAQRGHAQGNRIASGAPESRRRLRSFATVAAVVLIALGAGIFGLMSHRTQGLGGQRLATVATPAHYDFSKVPATPLATYTPQNKLIKAVVTATGADNNHVPIGPTSHFLMTKPNGSQNASAVVSLIVYVRGVPKGEQHTVSVHWYIQDVDVGLTPNADTVQPIAADANVLFTLAYPQPGLGTARIFLDLPNNETSNPTTDPHLAATINFAILPPNAGTPQPTATAAPSLHSGTNYAGILDQVVLLVGVLALLAGVAGGIVFWVLRRRMAR